jgi:hypothetical protein
MHVRRVRLTLSQFGTVCSDLRILPISFILQFLQLLEGARLGDARPWGLKSAVTQNK